MQWRLHSDNLNLVVLSQILDIKRSADVKLVAIILHLLDAAGCFRSIFF